MSLKLNEIYSGFKVLESSYIDEVHSQAFIMEHLQSGAKLFYLKNDDDNKVFSISFRTPPADDTGVPHILEHSSLCGSRKYHLKEPFVDLVKGSLNTFLNAMTYPDKTVYPVASRNAKDFRNLMDVYLDAVFYPLIYENKYTLRQEGWHYNIDDPKGELTYNGVVYNEMKGVYSSADAFLENEAMKALFTDTCYRFESGGYPDAIPQLTQEKFEEFHKQYYNPENSYIYLYGDMDIIAILAYLDEEYLSNFSKTNTLNSQISLQTSLTKTEEVESFYPIDKNEDCNNKTYHELSIVTGKSTDILTNMSLRLLEGVLLESEASPLRRALLQAGVGQNISGGYASSLLQPIFSIRAAGSEQNLKDKFISVIYKTLQELTVYGLDKKLLEAALNSLEFKLREADFGQYPKGLIYCLSVMDTWIYGANPIDGLRYEGYLAKMRAGLKTNYYENLIETYLLDNTHKVLVTLLPQPGKEEEDQAIAAEKMQNLKDSMSKEEIDKYIYECSELHRLQAEPDSEEARAAIPLLKRTDIRRDVEKIIHEVNYRGNNKLVYVPAVTNNIVYTNWYFDISSITVQQLSIAYLLVDLLGKFNTQRYTYEEIATNSIMYTGGMAFNIRAISKAENADDYKIYFILKGKALLANLPKMFDILQSVILESKLDDVQRFQELIGELKTEWDNEFFNKGQNIAIARLYAYCSDAARVNEQGQFTYYQFLKDLTENFAAKGKEILGEMQKLVKDIFNANAFSLFYSCDQKIKEKVENICLDFSQKLNKETLKSKTLPLPLSNINEGITTAGKVQYVAVGGNFAKYGHKFTGAMRVLETILRYEYLWTKIRIQGGAYGATARFELNGLGVFASYRDPQLVKTLQAYKELASWLKTVNFTERELDKYVIGTISGMDTPLTNSMRLEQVALQNLKDFSYTTKQRIRNEVLDVTNADLQALGKVVEDMLSDNYICVVGGKQIIEKNKDVFAHIIQS